MGDKAEITLSDVHAIQDAMINLNLERFMNASRGLDEELRAAGLQIQSVTDLHWPGVADQRAFPILARWFRATDYFELKEEILAILTRPWAKTQAPTFFLEEYRKIAPGEHGDDGSLRWSLADGLKQTAGDAIVSDLIELAGQKGGGPPRYLLILALARMKSARPVVIPHLLGWLDDVSPDVYVAAADVLGRWKVGDALPFLTRLIERPMEEPIPADALLQDRSWNRSQLVRAQKKLIRETRRIGEASLA